MSQDEDFETFIHDTHSKIFYQKFNVRSFKADTLPKLPFCICWDLIPKGKKLAFEIGAGNGMFSRQFVRGEPDWFLLSLERTANKSGRHFEILRTLKSHYPNLYFLRADAISFVAQQVPDTKFDKIFLLYPNPYPKKKQSNLRWHNMSFFSELLRTLKPGGQIEMRTNLDWYSKEFEKALNERFAQLRLITKNVLGNEHSPQTAFEKKYLEQGQSCFQLIYRLQENSN